MTWKFASATFGVVAMLAVPANALTLTNTDETIYSIELVIGQGDANVQQMALHAGQTVDDICYSGCTIRLSNGAEQSFEGDEIVTIRDGAFALVE